MPAEVGAVEGMVLESETRTLYWTCSSAAAVRYARLADLQGRSASTGTSMASTGTTLLQLERGDRPRGIDVDSCEQYILFIE